MSSCPITSWEIDGETVETVSDFIFLGSKITADCDFSHEIKRCLLLGRKVITSLDSIFKSRDVVLPTKVRLVKAMVFPVVTYGCESWTVKKAEHWRTDAFELWCWRRLLRVPWTARRSNQCILKEISPGILLSPCLFNLYTACVRVCMFSQFSCVQLFATLWTEADPATLSMGLCREEYWSGLPCLPPGDLPNPSYQTHFCLCLLHCRQILYPLSYLGSHK